VRALVALQQRLELSLKVRKAGSCRAARGGGRATAADGAGTSAVALVVAQAVARRLRGGVGVRVDVEAAACVSLVPLGQGQGLRSREDRREACGAARRGARTDRRGSARNGSAGLGRRRLVDALLRGRVGVATDVCRCHSAERLAAIRAAALANATFLNKFICNSSFLSAWFDVS
jgi:hypothetical protein